MNNLSLGEPPDWPLAPLSGGPSQPISLIPTWENKVNYWTKKFVEYIWIDGLGKLRSKTKLIDFVDEPPEWQGCL